MHKWKPLSALVAACLLASNVAHADPKDDARRHFGAGLEAARTGNFEVALQRFLAAQEAYPHPSMLYNIAKAYTDLDDLPNALAYYRLFRDASPERAADVDPIITVLEARLGAREAPQAAISSGRSSAAGPTMEELARLQTIASELEALSAALQRRTEEEAVLAEETAPDVEGSPLAEGGTSSGAGIEDDFLEDAYARTVVTASRVGQDPLDSPSSVAVLTADDIRLSGVTNVPDLLRRVVGVDVMNLASSTPDVSIRGFNNKLNNKVLVLIDGRSQYLDFLGGTIWPTFPIQLEEIERIEVIRGPGSAVYGANAVTGVINIITRTPGEGDQVVRVDAGAPALLRAAAVASGRIGETTYRLSAGYQQHRRWAKELNMADNPNSAQVPFFDNDDLGLQSLQFNARVDRTISKNVAVSLSGGISDAQTEFYATGSLPNYYVDLAHQYLRADLFLSKLHLRTFWNNHNGVTGPWLQTKGAIDRLNAEFDNDVVDVELEAPLQFATGPIKHTLNVGGGYRLKRFAFSYLSGGFENAVIENHGKAFLNEQIQIGRFGAVVSLRADLHPLIPLDRTLSPRGALLFRLFDKTSLRLSGGSAYRAPNGIESYMDLNLPTPTDGVFIRDLGNVDLVPERIVTAEFGVHDESSFYHRADVAVYFNQVTNLIGLDDVTTGITPFNPVTNGISLGDTGWINLEPQFTGVGVEADLELYPVDGLDIFANVNVMQVTETENDVSVREGSASQLKINGGVSYRSPYRLDVGAAAHYLSGQTWRLRQFSPDPTNPEIVVVERDIPSRLLLSARVAFRPIPNEDFEIAATAWNITELLQELSGGESGFLEHPEGQPVGGRAFASLTYRF